MITSIISYNHNVRDLIPQNRGGTSVLAKLQFTSQFLNPAQWPARSKTRVPDFDRVTRLPGSILFFFLNQNDVVLIFKKQKLTSCNRVFDRVLPGRPEFFFFLKLGPVPAPGRPDPGATRRAGFQNYSLQETSPSTWELFIFMF